MSIKLLLGRQKRRALLAILKCYDLIMDSNKHSDYRLHISGYYNPNYSFDANQIAFLHVPKTGGTSVSRLLEKDPRQRFPNLNIHRPISNNCPPQQYEYVTILRDPVERVWSHYQMLIQSRNKAFDSKFAFRGLEPFLRKCWYTRNLYCRSLTGQMKNEPNEKTLQLALSNLAQFKAVISFHNFTDETTTFLKDLDIPCEVIPNKRKSNYQPPNDKERSLIQQYNEWDIKLFDTWNEQRSNEALLENNLHK